MQRFVITLFFLGTLPLLADVVSSSEQTVVYSTTTAPHSERELLGFTVHVSDKALEDHETETESAYDLLSEQLMTFIRRFPVRVVEALREAEVGFILNNEGLNQEVCPFACYYPDAWFSGMYSKAVAIRDLKQFHQSQLEQPGLLIHEIAHAFHELIVPSGDLDSNGDGYVTGFDNSTIIEAYDRAKESGQFESVAHIWGERLLTEGLPINPKHNAQHYGMTNEKEFFATFSEALWSTDDQFPFNFHDVISHDILTNQTNLYNEVWYAWWIHTQPHAAEATWYFQTLTDDQVE